jgi:signal transduction histidine kinase
MRAPPPTVNAAPRIGIRDRGLSPVHVARRQAAEHGSTAPRALEGGEFFAGCVAHELRTPLATQRALLELALADPNTDAADWREVGEDVLAACRQQERLLEACLTLVRSRGGPQRCDPVDLAAITAEALRAHNLNGLDRVLALERAWTNGDPELLDRLVANLVSNAVRHNTVDGRIEIATRTESGRAVLSVANTGPVIPASEVPRLFEPFQRLTSSPKTFSDGLGLGLAIVEAIADAHRASITARARTDGGLEVDIGFPVTPTESARSGAA